MLVCFNCGYVIHECCDIYVVHEDGTVLCGDCEDVRKMEAEDNDC